MDGELVGAEADGAKPDAEDRTQALRPEVALPEGLRPRARIGRSRATQTPAVGVQHTAATYDTVQVMHQRCCVQVQLLASRDPGTAGHGQVCRASCQAARFCSSVSNSAPSRSWLPRITPKGLPKPPRNASAVSKHALPEVHGDAPSAVSNGAPSYTAVRSSSGSKPHVGCAGAFEC